MILLIIIFVLFVSLIGCLLFSPIIIEADSTIPQFGLWWSGLGTARIWYKNGFYLGIELLFFSKTIRLRGRMRRMQEVKSAAGRKRHGPTANAFRILAKLTRVIKSFRVREWKVAVDTGDYSLNGCLYPFNGMFGLSRNVKVNFNGENYFVVRVSNNLFRILRAWLG